MTPADASRSYAASQPAAAVEAWFCHAGHRAAQAVRTYLNEGGFIDVETPVLTKSTPEGVRQIPIVTDRPVCYNQMEKSIVPVQVYSVCEGGF